MLGIEAGQTLRRAGRAPRAGLLIFSVTADSVIRLVPPLILTARAEADDGRHPGR